MRGRGVRLCWPPELEQLYRGPELALLKQLPARSREVIAFHDLAFPLAAGCDEVVIDVSQSINRVTTATDVAPCVCPKSFLWMRRRRRIIEPNEELALQGMPLYTRDQLQDFSQREIRDLAGMAFCGHNVLAIMFGVFSTYDFPDVLAGSDTPPSPPSWTDFDTATGGSSSRSSGCGDSPVL